MAEKLIIYLHANDLPHPGWAIIHTDGTIRASLLHDEPENLAELAAEKDVIVIVPSEDVLLAAINLPKMNRTRLRQAIPFALEEQLIADVDTLHFAAGTYQANGDLTVAVIAHKKMQQWCALLHAWQLEATSMLPAALALPFKADEWCIFLHEIAIVRTGLTQGFAADKNNLAELVTLALSASVPKIIHVQNYSRERCLLTQEAALLCQENFVAPEQLIANLTVDKPVINLLQGPYVTKKTRLPQINKLWQTLYGLSAALILLWFIYPLGSYFILNQRLNVIDEQITQIYQRHFPEAKIMVAPKIRMSEKLHKMLGQNNESHFLLLMGYIGAGLQQTPTIKIKHLDYQNKQISLELHAAAAKDFASFTDYLQQQGLQVQQQNANLMNSQLVATLVIGV
jgi:general secretion pathway protein L